MLAANHKVDAFPAVHDAHAPEAKRKVASLLVCPAGGLVADVMRSFVRESVVGDVGGLHSPGYFSLHVFVVLLVAIGVVDLPQSPPSRSNLFETGVNGHPQNFVRLHIRTVRRGLLSDANR